MANCGNRAMGDLSATVAVHSISAAICKLLPEGSGAEAAVTKTQLRTMRDPTFEWPSPDEVRPEALPPLPKNIVKNFTSSVFKTHGRDLVRGEADRLRKQVCLQPFCEVPFYFVLSLNLVSTTASRQRRSLRACLPRTCNAGNLCGAFASGAAATAEGEGGHDSPTDEVNALEE